MKKETAIKLIEIELKKLGIYKVTDAYERTYSNCLEASDILNKSELKQMIVESIEFKVWKM